MAPPLARNRLTPVDSPPLRISLMEGLLVLKWLGIELRRLGVSLQGGPGLLWVMRGELLLRVCVVWGHLHLRLELEVSLGLCWHLELLLLL